MDAKNYIEGDKIVCTSFHGRIDVFQIVDEFPWGYEVWPIGRHNFPFPGYLPLATFENYHMRDTNCRPLKAIKIDEDLADKILHYSVRYGAVNAANFRELIKSL